MYGDTSVMRRRADELRDQGADIAMTADQLVAQSDAIAWSGRAADAMRARVRERATHLREAAAPARDGRRLADPSPRRGRPAQGVHRRGRAAGRARSSPTPAPASPGSRPTRRTRTAVRGEPRARPTRRSRRSSPPKPGHKDWLTVNLPRTASGGLMATVDLTTPPRPPESLLDGLPRRVALTLPELRTVARLAGDAPLPFDVTEPRPGRARGPDGPEPGSVEDAAYLAAVGSPARSPRLAGPPRPVSTATPSTPVWRAPSACSPPRPSPSTSTSASTTCRRRPGTARPHGAVATLATVDGIVFELAWFDAPQWPAELGRVAVVPEDAAAGPSAVPVARRPALRPGQRRRRGRAHRSFRPPAGAGHPARRPRSSTARGARSPTSTCAPCCPPCTTRPAGGCAPW